jgi:UTP--glucose-1-phosphate uridylyltransferase
VIARSVLALRARHEVRLPLVLLDSEATRGPSLAALARYAGLPADVPLDVLQHVEPRLRADDLRPVDWPADPRQECTPPGHGDLYATLHGSGLLAELRGRGYRYAFASNADNLGAVLDPRILAWFAAERIPFLMEVVRGTAADRKGGHIARRDGRLVLRETAQVPPGDTSFTDFERWRYYNANSLWLDLDALAAALDRAGGVLDLPLIANAKTLGDDVEVLQLETAMGSALGLFEGARVLHVPRSRFAPVKSTEDLLVVRSDAYVAQDDGRIVPADGREAPPFVELDPAYYRRLADFERRFPEGPPSLRRCERLIVRGDVTFGRDVRVLGDVTVSGPACIPGGTTLEGDRAA